MASEVDICNLALSHIGDTATVASINPPEGSAQAEHCARFYSFARDALFEMHDWNFCITRTPLNLLASAVPPWTYVYGVPNLLVTAIAVQSADAPDDFCEPGDISDAGVSFVPTPIQTFGDYTPQPYLLETLDDGTAVILTNVENAVLRYTRKITDASKFSALFVMALSWYLASLLAGPIIKGDEGAAESKRCLKEMEGCLVNATEADTGQRHVHVQHYVPWLVGR